MKIALVITLAIGLGLVCTALAAPVKLRAKSDLEIQLVKSLVSQAIIQAETTEGEGIAKQFCRLLMSAMKRIGIAPKENYCDDIDDDDSGIPDGGYTSSSEERERVLNVLKNILSPTDLAG